MTRTKRRNKYNARRTIVDNHTFDSKKEAERYMILRSRQDSGEISSLVIHPKYELQPAFVHVQSGKKIRAINYYGDFEYMDNDYNLIVEDVKGVETPVFKLKRKLFLRQYPHIIFRIIK